MSGCSRTGVTGHIVQVHSPSEVNHEDSYVGVSPHRDVALCTPVTSGSLHSTQRILWGLSQTQILLARTCHDFDILLGSRRHGAHPARSSHRHPQWGSASKEKKNNKKKYKILAGRLGCCPACSSPALMTPTTHSL